MKRDYYAGGLMMLIGLGAALEGSRYPIGTLARVGPGAFPVGLGIALAFVGLLIAGAALASPGDGRTRVLPEHPPWFGWACLVLGPTLFILLGTYCGMIPAIFACVFVSAYGDHASTLKSSLLLALGSTAFGVVLFHHFLQLQFPLLVWRLP